MQYELGYKYPAFLRKEGILTNILRPNLLLLFFQIKEQSKQAKYILTLLNF
jgi:hypothetical protein